MYIRWYVLFCTGDGHSLLVAGMTEKSNKGLKTKFPWKYMQLRKMKQRSNSRHYKPIKKSFFMQATQKNGHVLYQHSDSE